MDINKFKGIFPALCTPFDDNGKINEKALEEIVKYDVKQGANGFYVCGSTGEAFMLSVDERKQVMEIVKSVAPEKTLIAHVGTLNENDAIDLAKHAKKLGYDAISSVTPYYFKFSFDEIKNYYFRVADAADMKMLVYHIPGFSGVSMGTSEISQFLGDDRFIGIKYTSSDLFTLERCKTLFSDKIVYNGFDEMFIAGLSMGADGAIGTTYNFMCDKFVKIYNLFKEQKIQEAQAIQREANRIIALLIKMSIIPATKEILTQKGINAGICRKPFKELTEEEKQIITKEVIPYI
jgi:N-acetylneuraminate lyase